MCLPGRRPESSLLAALILAIFASGAGSAVAQTGAPTPLRLETQQIERDLGATQQALGELPEGRQAAILLNRINAIEEQLRRLTGRIEEAEFHDRRIEARIDQLVADLDRRLASLEDRPMTGRPGIGGPAPETMLGGADPLGAAGEAAQTGSVAGEQALPEVMTVEPGDSPASRPTADIEPDPSARDGFVLGTIPRDALLGIPQPRSEGPTGTAPPEALQGNAASRFDAALDLLQTGDYGAAEVAFDRWMTDFPDDPQAAVASFWLGEAQLAQGELADAAATFAGNYRTFGPEGPRAADNLLKLGTALAAMGDTSRACQTFAELDRRYRDAGSGLRQALEREQRAAGCN